jgi:hypothetical protein
MKRNLDSRGWCGPILFLNLDNVTEHVPKCTCSRIRRGVSYRHAVIQAVPVD